MDGNVASALVTVAHTIPDAVAVVHGPTHRTWASLLDRAQRLAAALQEQGVQQGDRVGIGLWSSPAYLESILAALLIEAVPFNVNYRYRAEELGYILRDSGARVLIYDPVNAAVVAETLGQHDEDILAIHADTHADTQADPHGGTPDGAQPAAAPLGDDLETLVTRYDPLPEQPLGPGGWLLYTGGTTGHPKAVSSSHPALWASLVPNSFAKLGLPTPGSQNELADLVRPYAAEPPFVVLSAAPLIHGTGVYSVLGALVCGGRAVMPTGRSFDPEQLLRTCQAQGVTDLVIVGDVMARPLVDTLDRLAAEGAPLELPALRRVASVGAVFSASAKAALLQHVDAEITDLVVASEGGPFAIAVTTRTPSGPDASPTGGDAVGVTSRFMLFPGARLLDSDDRDVVAGSGVIGRLAAPAHPDMGYRDVGADDPTYKIIDGERWCVPGDLAELLADGTLAFQGRGSRVINTGGEKVFAEEVETVILDHPAVVDALVVGVPDERYGQAVSAVVTLADGADLDLDGLRAHVTSRLSGYKQPRHLVVVPEVRRTPVGKADLAWAKQVATDALP